MAGKEASLAYMNRIRLFTSGCLLLFAGYSLLFDPDLPFMQSPFTYSIAFFYFAIFPIKDMISACNPTLYKGRQFARHFQKKPAYDQAELNRTKRHYNRRACYAMLFWLCFVAIPGGCYWMGMIDRSVIFFLFALSNFSVFYAIFGWCPFHAIFIQPDCCMECRIYNWDSFFQYSFLVFFPHPYPILLFLLGLTSLIEWEIMHAIHPERFYKLSNQSLRCERCDLGACRHHKKSIFSGTWKKASKRKRSI